MFSKNLSCLHIGSNASQYYNVYQNQALGWIVNKSVVTHDNRRRCLAFLPGFHPLMYLCWGHRQIQTNICSRERDQITTPPCPAEPYRYFLCLKRCQTFNSYYESVFKCPIFWNMLTSLTCVNMSVQFTVPHRNISLWKQLTPLSFWKYTIVDISEWFIKTSFPAQCLAL